MKIFVTDKWKVIKYTSVVSVICLVFVAINNISWDVVATLAGDGKLVPIYNIETTEPKVSLTFDCAWGAEDMDKILQILKDENIRATFFVLGEWVEKNPEVIKKMAQDGHDIANHSDTHPYLTGMTYDEIKAEINEANKKITKVSGKENNLFRAPYGDYNDNVIKAVTDEGYYCIQWDVDSLDWKNLGKEDIINRVLTKTKNGSIILMHNGTIYTSDALKEMLVKLKEKGFAFVPISEFIYKDNYTIDHAGKQIEN